MPYRFFVENDGNGFIFDDKVIISDGARTPSSAAMNQNQFNQAMRAVNGQEPAYFGEGLDTIEQYVGFACGEPRRYPDAAAAIRPAQRMG